MSLSYTEQHQTNRTQGFSARIRTNKLHPRSSEPLIIIEFSLTDAIRDSLYAAIKAYVAKSGKIANDEKLGEIMAHHMPKEIMQQLKVFGNTVGAKTVFVIHNLPQTVTQKKLVSRRNEYSTQHKYKHMMHKCSEISCVQYGIAAQLGLNFIEEEYLLFRSTEDSEIAGAGLHKHSVPIDFLGAGIINGEPAATQFTDFKAALEKASRDKDLRELRVSVKPGHNTMMSLGEFNNRWGNYTRACSIRIKLEEVLPDKINNWEKLISSCSQEVALRRDGDGASLAVWNNGGDLLHQALPDPNSQNIDSVYSRIAIGIGYQHAGYLR